MKLPEQCREELNKAYEKTKNNTGLTLNLALNYGGRYDLLQAFKGIMKEVHEGKINESEIDEQTISDHLFTAGMPDPDIIIRPSG